jgi:hypothetical protein
MVVPPLVRKSSFRICYAARPAASQFLHSVQPTPTRYPHIQRCFRSAAPLRHHAGMALPQTIVYVLKSDIDPTRYYTGLTSNLAARLDAHNAGRVPHTKDGKPWIIDVVRRVR